MNEKKPNILKRIFLPLFRAIAKSIPLSSTIVNIVDEIKLAKKENRNPSNGFEFLIELLIVSGIVYGFVTKAITIEEFINLLKQI